MCDVAIKTENGVKIILSVHTPDYVDKPDTLINPPNIRTLVNEPEYYLKIVEEGVITKTAEEIQIMDQQLEEEKLVRLEEMKIECPECKHRFTPDYEI